MARPIVALLNPGLLGDAAAVAAGLREVDRFPIAVAGVRIVFPMTALLVVAAWCLGVLNTHGRFFLSYFAPVLWNAAVIGALLWVGGSTGADAGVDPTLSGRRLVLAACVGALAGAALQLAVQMPFAVRLIGGFRPRFSLRDEAVREAVARFGPALLGRGAVQLSGWLDLVLASFLTVGTLAALGWAQRVYLLPVALFGFSIAAVELPELARLAAGERDAATRRRFDAAFRRSVFVVAPTVVGFVALGFLMVGLLYRGGSFGPADNWMVYLVLAAYTLGLPATVVSRLLQNLFFAAGDTRTPARVAFLRLVVSTGLGAAAGFGLDRFALSTLVGIPGSRAAVAGRGRPRARQRDRGLVRARRAASGVRRAPPTPVLWSRGAPPRDRSARRWWRRRRAVSCGGGPRSGSARCRPCWFSPPTPRSTSALRWPQLRAELGLVRAPPWLLHRRSVWRRK